MQGPIWIKTIECWGNESSLAACPGAVWEHNYYCKHSEDVGLECLLTQHSDTGSQGGGEVGGYVDIMMYTDISVGHSIKLRLGAVRQGGGGSQAGAAGGQGGGRPDCSARVTALDCQHQVLYCTVLYCTVLYCKILRLDDNHLLACATLCLLVCKTSTILPTR